ncbi:MAG: hypothetical protein J3R72DRAFT_121270 [Linnemannia gamsii]|nr:MAG: hypothetical protein J3R72DRAFT_121270 [Linnemannia gamsii]
MLFVMLALLACMVRTLHPFFPWSSSSTIQRTIPSFPFLFRFSLLLFYTPFFFHLTRIYIHVLYMSHTCTVGERPPLFPFFSSFFFLLPFLLPYSRLLLEQKQVPSKCPIDASMSSFCWSSFLLLPSVDHSSQYAIGRTPSFSTRSLSLSLSPLFYSLSSFSRSLCFSILDVLPRLSFTVFLGMLFLVENKKRETTQDGMKTHMYTQTRKLTVLEDSLGNN